jgi:hypothetical protein
MSSIANELAEPSVHKPSVHEPSVKGSRRRAWIYILLFLLSVVAYVDRISI